MNVSVTTHVIEMVMNREMCPLKVKHTLYEISREYITKLEPLPNLFSLYSSIHPTFPLLISTDQEGGVDDRLSNIYPRHPGATEIAATGDVRVAAHDLLALGINADIAPDVELPQAAVLAIKAGDDMILGASGVAELTADFKGIKQALQNGTLTKERIDESVTRILALKMQYHIMPAVPPQT